MQLAVSDGKKNRIANEIVPMLHRNSGMRMITAGT
jgi:hypothetical protein